MGTTIVFFFLRPTRTMAKGSLEPPFDTRLRSMTGRFFARHTKTRTPFGGGSSEGVSASNDSGSGRSNAGSWTRLKASSTRPAAPPRRSIKGNHFRWHRRSASVAASTEQEHMWSLLDTTSWSSTARSKTSSSSHSRAKLSSHLGVSVFFLHVERVTAPAREPNVEMQGVLNFGESRVRTDNRAGRRRRR